MDEFWTEAENAFRARAAGLCRVLDDPEAAGVDAALDELWRAAGASLSGLVAVLDEAAHRDPRLGDRLLARAAPGLALEPAVHTACVLGRLAGTALHVFEAGTRVAQERGFYSSILMDFREVQERLAALVSGAALARFGACRICRLLQRGDSVRAGREAEGLRVRASALDAEIRSVAAFLLGPGWTLAPAPLDAFLSADERTAS